MADVMFLKLLLIGIVVCSVFVKTRIIEVQDVEAVRFSGLELVNSRKTTAFIFGIAIFTQFVFV